MCVLQVNGVDVSVMHDIVLRSVSVSIGTSRCIMFGGVAISHSDPKAIAHMLQSARAAKGAVTTEDLEERLPPFQRQLPDFDANIRDAASALKEHICGICEHGRRRSACGECKGLRVRTYYRRKGAYSETPPYIDFKIEPGRAVRPAVNCGPPAQQRNGIKLVLV